MSITVGLYDPMDVLGAAAWTTGTLAPGDRIIYCSNDGDDGDDGLTLVTAVATIEHGISLLRDGRGDWLLLRKGDTWTEGNQVTRSGRSASEPIIISCYDEDGDTSVFNPATGAARPLIKIDETTGDGFVSQGGGPDAGTGGEHVFYIGLDLYAHKRDPDSPSYDFTMAGEDHVVNGIALLNPFSSNLIEDCRIRFFCQNIGFQGKVIDRGYTFSSGVRVRRSVVTDAYRITANGGNGMEWSGVNDVVIEENVFDHNGYLEGDYNSLKLTASSSATVGAVYSDGTSNFTVHETLTDGTVLKVTQGAVSPTKRDWSGASTNSKTIGTGAVTFNDVVPSATPIVGQSCFANAGSGNVMFGTVTSFAGTTLVMNITSVTGSGTFSSWTLEDDNVGHWGVLTKQSGTGDTTLIYKYMALTAAGNYGFSHQLYDSGYNSEYDTGTISNKPTLRSNLFSRGLDLQLRGGGNFTNNVYVKFSQAMALAFPTVGVHTISGDVFLQPTINKVQGANIGAASGNYSVHFDFGSLLVDGCVFANSALDGSGYAIGVDTYTTTYRNNIIYKWNSPAMVPASSTGNTTVEANNKVDLDGDLEDDNTSADYSSVWSDPDRTIESYDTSIGGPGTFAHFLDGAKANNKLNWSFAYTAAAVERYIKGGFGIYAQGARTRLRLR